MDCQVDGVPAFDCMSGEKHLRSGGVGTEQDCIDLCGVEVDCVWWQYSLIGGKQQCTLFVQRSVGRASGTSIRR